MKELFQKELPSNKLFPYGFLWFWGYQREPEGWGSWQQLLLVTSVVVAMVFFAVFFGMRYRHEEEAKKLFVLKVTAIVLDTIELTRIVVLSFRSGNPMQFMYHLPLFLLQLPIHHGANRCLWQRKDPRSCDRFPFPLWHPWLNRWNIWSRAEL